jgi:wyosine [tRNA(Phe)-imidazoG37] synthetase (radical SAM superfamily)
LNTNGTCLERLSLEETTELLEPFDSVSVSLNASSKEKYNNICRPAEGTAWDSMLKFIELAGKAASVKLTAVSYPGLDMESVAELAARLSLPFRVRS